MIGSSGGTAVTLLVFIYVRTRKTIRQADDGKKLTNAAFSKSAGGENQETKQRKKNRPSRSVTPKVPDSFKEAMQLIRTRTEDGL